VLEAAEVLRMWPRVARKSIRRPPGATIESLARIDELARVWEMVKVTQADRLEWCERATCRWPASEAADQR
jgi:hypothetical protein